MKQLKGGFSILPPAPGSCPVCARAHDPALPHDKKSLYYQITFNDEHGRYPTWWDAARHCTDELRSKWFELLPGFGEEVGEDLGSVEK